MSIRIRTAVFLAALAATAAVPSVASAGTEQMRGVVSGSPYGASGGQMAIPVLFSKMTARNAGLKSPVGVIIVKRSAKVKLPNGSGFALPVQLRTGDRFKGVGEVGSLQRRVFYPRVVFTKPVVYFRSKELSLSELSTAVDSLRKALADLQSQLKGLSNYTAAGFAALLNEINGLKAQLAGLQIPAAADLSGLQSQIDSLRTDLNGVINSLKDYAKLTDVDKKIADAIAALNLLTPQDVTNSVNNILSAIGFTNLTQLKTLISSTINDVLADPAAALTQTVQGLIDGTIASDVPGMITTAINTDVPGLVTTGINNTVPGLIDTAITNQVPALVTSGINAQVPALVTSGVNAADLNNNASFTTVKNQAAALQAKLTALCSALNIPAITSLAPNVATACS